MKAHLLDLISLKLLIACNHFGKLSSAAHNMHLVPSAASRRITQLEEELGVPLLHRSRGGVSLTPAGGVAVEQALVILAACDKLYANLGAFSEGVRGSIRLWATSSALSACLPRVFKAFHGEHAMVQIDLEERADQEVVEAVKDGIVDIGLFGSHQNAYGVRTHVVGKDDIVLVVPADHPLAERDAVHFEDALDFDFIGWGEGVSLGAAMQSAALASNSALKVTLRVKSIGALCSLVSSGIAIGAAPSPYVIPEARQLGLKTVGLLDTWAKRGILMGYRSSDALGPAARVFARYLREMEPGVSPAYRPDKPSRGSRGGAS